MCQIFFNNVLIFTLYIFDITFLYKERNKKKSAIRRTPNQNNSYLCSAKGAFTNQALRKVKRKLGAKPKQCQLL